MILDRLRALWTRLRSHLRPGADYRDMDEELQFHFDREVARLVAGGTSAREAHDAARRALGNLGATHEDMRRATHWAWLGRLDRDIRYAVRSLSRVPVLSIGVIGTIALAIGLNAAVFTLFDAYVLRPRAVRDPRSLQQVIAIGRGTTGPWGDSRFDADGFRAITASSTAVAGAVAYRDVYVRVDDVPAIGELVSPEYFASLGVSTVLGRPLLPSDATMAGGAVVVLSHAAWRARWGGDSSIVGHVLTIRGRPFTVVGVAPPAYTGLTEVTVDFWAPIGTAGVLDGTAGPSAVWPPVSVVVRLKPDVTPEQGAAAIGAMVVNAERDAGRARGVTGVVLESRATVIPMSTDTLLAAVPIAVAFLLVFAIACANVANMMLARGLARQRELGVRMALGAGRWQVVRQLLVESSVLALPAAALGYGISRLTLDVSTRAMVASFPPAFAAYVRLVPLKPSPLLFAFLLVAACGAALLFGLAPALQATRGDVVAATRGDLGGNFRAGRLRNLLVVVQVAACVLLLTVAAVLMRGSAAARRLDPGFDVRQLVSVEVTEQHRADALAALRARSDVAGIEAAGQPPARGWFGIVPGGLAGSPDIRGIYVNRVSAGYFAALHMPMRGGRGFTAQEVATEAPVVILSETAARHLAPGRSAVGLNVRLAADATEIADAGLSPFRTARVVGVVADAAPGLVIIRPDVTIAYYPLSVDSATQLILTARGGVRGAAQAIARDFDRSQPASLREVVPVQEVVDGSIYPFRAASWIAGALGVLALILTWSGLYGVLAYLVTQRRREIGVRMALGARRPGVVALFARQSLRLAGVGMTIGVALALGVSRIFATSMLAVTTFDWVAYAGSVTVAASACAVAAVVPSWRAASVDPSHVLRSE